MKLIVVTAPTFFVEEDQILTALFEEGLDILHLRKPETPAMYSERLLTLIPKKYHKRIVTHEHFYLQEEFGLMGIHLNARNAHEPDDYSGNLSCTCTSLEDLKNKKHFYDYMFLSPVFDAVTNPNLKSPFRKEELRLAKKQKVIDNKVMAYGGITLETIQEVKELGFGGAVVMGDLWTRFDTHNDRDYLEIIRHFKQLKKKID
ncbi:MAG: thiamine phosphate synthase [Bacteroides sp.]|nr:thiamine phosphate synthase [Bacteroides sp.]